MRDSEKRRYERGLLLGDPDAIGGYLQRAKYTIPDARERTNEALKIWLNGHGSLDDIVPVMVEERRLAGHPLMEEMGNLNKGLRRVDLTTLYGVFLVGESVLGTAPELGWVYSCQREEYPHGTTKGAFSINWDIYEGWDESVNFISIPDEEGCVDFVTIINGEDHYERQSDFSDFFGGQEPKIMYSRREWGKKQVRELYTRALTNEKDYTKSEIWSEC